VVGLPKFADETHWEINAKVPTTGEGAPNVVNGRPLPPPLSIGLEMLNNLLIDRFGLKTHRGQREITVYVLTAGKGKPKMTAAKDSDRTDCKPAPNATPPMPGIRMTGCTNTSMGELAVNMQRMAPAYIDHPVVDETGIEGGWNFFIGWTPRSMLRPSLSFTVAASASTSNAVTAAPLCAPRAVSATVVAKGPAWSRLEA